MDVQYTVKVKGKNVPEFKKGLGKGVIAKVTITYDDKILKEISTPRLLLQLMEEEDKIVKECVVSSFKILKDKKKKKK